MQYLYTPIKLYVEPIYPPKAICIMSKPVPDKHICSMPNQATPIKVYAERINQSRLI